MNASARQLRHHARPMKWWYEFLADYMIANPTALQNEIAAHFGRSPATISIIINTDAFKAYLRQRRNTHEAALDAEVRGKLFKVANNSLDLMLHSLEKKRDTIPLEILHRTTDTALKSLGYGAPSPAGTTVNVSTAPTVNVAVSVEDLENARQALRRNQQQAIDVTPEPSSEARSGVSPASEAGSATTSSSMDEEH